MKIKNQIIRTGLLGLFMVLILGACKNKFLEQTPQGELIDEQTANTKGVEFLLIGAYGMLNGSAGGTWGTYGAAPDMWQWGELPSDNLHKGSDPTDQADLLDVEQYVTSPTSSNLGTMWTNTFEGVIRSNTTLRFLKEVQENAEEKFPDERAKEIEAEAKFLRGHYYFRLWLVFKNVPYVDETLTTAESVEVPNDVDIMPMIEQDFQFAVENLPEDRPLGEVGRANKKAAKAYLGKVYLYEEKYDEAFELLDDVITSSEDLTTLDFDDNFNIRTENGPESIFAVQHEINPDGSGDNANTGDMLGGFYGSAPINCCGFQQPTFDLANAFRVDDDGLPMLDGSYREEPYLSDFGLSSADKKEYEVDQSLHVDPRLDFTLGRRGVPFRDWGLMGGDNWIRDAGTAGPFVGYKQMINLADVDGNTASGESYITALNVNIIRLADVYLMAAECAVKGSAHKDLGYALEKVNAVRERAQNLISKGKVPKLNGDPAADYEVKPYPDFPNEEYAMKAVQFERRLELAEEGMRFFDLRRWGIALEALEEYIAFESQYLDIYKSSKIGEDQLYQPIPQNQIDRSNNILVQNPGY